MVNVNHSDKNRRTNVKVWNIKINKSGWLQFLFVVKATALKWQISKFYPQFLSIEISFHIYDPD